MVEVKNDYNNRNGKGEITCVDMGDMQVMMEQCKDKLQKRMGGKQSLNWEKRIHRQPWG